MSTETPRWVMHPGMDAFYVAVEQRDDRSASGRSWPAPRPAARGGGHLLLQGYRRCQDAVYLRPCMDDYPSVARHIRTVIATCAPVVEPISIDETFLDLHGLGHLIGPPGIVGPRIRKAIRAAVGLTASVGIGPNRLRAPGAARHGPSDPDPIRHANASDAEIDSLSD